MIKKFLKNILNCLMVEKYTLMSFDDILREEEECNENCSYNTNLTYIKELKICTKLPIGDKIQLWSCTGNKYYTYNTEKLFIFLEWFHAITLKPLRRGRYLPHNDDFIFQINNEREENNIICVCIEGGQSYIIVHEIDLSLNINFQELTDSLEAYRI